MLITRPTHADRLQELLAAALTLFLVFLCIITTRLDVVHAAPIVAPDLSGHGDSGTRDSYDLRRWSREVMAAAAAFSDGHPTIVGHSLGGWVTATAASHFGDQINSIVVVDSPLRDRAPEERHLSRRTPKAYRSKDEIVGRFRPVPAQQGVLPYVSARQGCATYSSTQSPDASSCSILAMTTLMDRARRIRMTMTCTGLTNFLRLLLMILLVALVDVNVVPHLYDH